jgi:hypothetical protein
MSLLRQCSSESLAPTLSHTATVRKYLKRLSTMRVDVASPRTFFKAGEGGFELMRWIGALTGAPYHERAGGSNSRSALRMPGATSWRLTRRLRRPLPHA